MKGTALRLSAVIFLLVSLAHLLRLALKVDIIVGQYFVPAWLSYFGFIVPLFLSIWMFNLSRK